MSGSSAALSGAEFLATYFRGTQGEIYLSAIRNGDSKLKRGELDYLVGRDLGRARNFIAKYDTPKHETAIYFTTATLGPGQTARNAANCWEFTSIFADIDDKSHELDRQHVIVRLNALPCPPSIIVNSGHGLQPHWLLDEPSEDFRRLEALRKLVQDLTASDRVHDAPRLMRLPGSHNSKRGDWIPVEVISFHPDYRYSLEAIEEWLGAADIIIPRKPAPAKTNGTALDRPFLLPPVGGMLTDDRRGSAWARRALEESARELANAGEGSRHNTLRDKSVRMGTMIARGWIDVQEVRAAFLSASEACGQINDYGPEHFAETFAAGLKHGIAMPHPDLPDKPYQVRRRFFPQGAGAGFAKKALTK